MRSKNKKIALLTPRFGIADRGAEGFTYQLARRLQGEFEVTVYARKRIPKDTTISAFQEVNEGFRVIKVGCITEHNRVVTFLYKLHPWVTSLMDRYFLSPTSFEMLTFSLAVFPRLLFNSYDIIFPNNGVWGALVCRIVRAIKGTPFAYISHGGIEPMIAKQRPNVYFALSRAIKRWYNNQFPSLHVVFIPTPTDTTRFTPYGDRVKLELEHPIFITVAALIPVKRIDLAISAVARLKKGSLLVVGQGYLKDKLVSLGNRLLEKKRFLIIELPNDKVPLYYRAADAFTLAARGEHGSVTPVEALSSNLPVVASNEEYLRSVIGKAGILVDTEDIGSYSKALEEAAHNSFGNIPRIQALKFSWDRMEKIYRRELLKLVR